MGVGSVAVKGRTISQYGRQQEMDILSTNQEDHFSKRDLADFHSNISTAALTNDHYWNVIYIHRVFHFLYSRFGLPLHHESLLECYLYFLSIISSPFPILRPFSSGILLTTHQARNSIGKRILTPIFYLDYAPPGRHSFTRESDK